MPDADIRKSPASAERQQVAFPDHGDCFPIPLYKQKCNRNNLSGVFIMNVQVCRSDRMQQGGAAQATVPLPIWDSFVLQESGTAHMSSGFQAAVKPGAVSCALEGWGHRCHLRVCIALVPALVCVTALQAKRSYLSLPCPISASFLDYILPG
jgi:hypothetical protein